MQRVNAVAISEYMKRKLSALGMGQVGRVLSVHRELFNVVLCDGDLLTVQSSWHIRTPMSLEVSQLSLARIEVEQPIWMMFQPDRLRCGELEIVFDNTEVFSNRAVVEAQQDIKPAEFILRQHLSGRDDKRSVFYFISDRTPSGSEQGLTDGMEQTYGETLRRLSTDLLTAIESGDGFRAMEAGKAFIGLGPGMTPAGDDFLQGFLLFVQASQSYGLVSKEMIGHLKRLQPMDTTMVSRALWAHLLAGRVSSPAVKLVEAFNLGNWDDFRIQVEILGGIGHSSGDDFLSGVWFALHALRESATYEKAGGAQRC